MRQGVLSAITNLLRAPCRRSSSKPGWLPSPTSARCRSSMLPPPSCCSSRLGSELASGAAITLPLPSLLRAASLPAAHSKSPPTPPEPAAGLYQAWGRVAGAACERRNPEFAWQRPPNTMTHARHVRHQPRAAGHLSPPPSSCRQPHKAAERPPLSLATHHLAKERRERSAGPPPPIRLCTFSYQ